MGKSVRVGIPRALLYYQYYPMWKTFFEHLGSELVVSSPTTREMLAAGSSKVVAETCLPVKVFLGHVYSLADRCDYMFVPAIRSIEKRVHNCSKFLGLPDMTKAVIPECPPILDIDIDMDKGRRELYLAIYRLGRHFTWNPIKVRQAADAAWQVHQEYQSQMYREVQMPCQLIDQFLGESGNNTDNNLDYSKTIALVGHPYLLYDDFVNYRLIHHLNRRGCRVFTPEMVRREDIEGSITTLVEKSYWTYEDEVVGAGGYYLQSQINGVIGLVAFGCGPDSLMMNIVQRYAKNIGKPFIMLTLDEHASETGLITRLEAFLDMIERKQRGKIGCS